MGKLTATGIKALLKKPGRHSDGDGLILNVGKNGAASWLVRIQKNGHRRDFGLGSFKKVPLTLARERAEQARRDVEAGIDPIQKKRQAAGIPTFREAAASFLVERDGQWGNAKHAKQWVTTLTTYVYPFIGDASVATIDGPAVRELLLPIWVSKAETARRVLQRVTAVLDWAMAKGYRPAPFPSKSVANGLPKQVRKAKHHEAMPYADVSAFMAYLQERESWGRLALQATILTAARSGETRGATWDEVDLDKALWTIPAHRMKGGREHVVPLSPAALAVFKRAAELKTAGTPYVFNSMKRGKPLSDMTLTKIMRDAGQPFTVHGFRSSFRDWVSEETDHPSELAEASLAHAVKDKVEAAYKRGTMLAKRAGLMAAWGDYADRRRPAGPRLVASN